MHETGRSAEEGRKSEKEIIRKKKKEIKKGKTRRNIQGKQLPVPHSGHLLPATDGRGRWMVLWQQEIETQKQAKFKLNPFEHFNR